MRAVSTVLDVSLFLLLVGAAVGLVAVSSAPSVDGPVAPTDPADEVAETLASSTARVNYSLGPDLAGTEWAPLNAAEDPILTRSDHGSYAALLAEATVANGRLLREPLTIGGDEYASAVRDVTRRAIRLTNGSAAVRATWRPYVDAHLVGDVSVGGRAPPDVDVRTATVTVDSGFRTVRDEVRAAAEDEGFDGVAAVLANATVEKLFPERATRLAVRSGYPTAATAEARYAAVDDALDGIDLAVEEDGVRQTNANVESALAEWYADDLRRIYGDPGVAAQNVRMDSVTVVVRTWSR